MNDLKTPLGVSLNKHARGRAFDAIQLIGKALPCTVTAVRGAIVTVKFEVQSGFTLPSVTMPVAGSIYMREPIQAGDHGLAVPSDAYLGGVSGLGGGIADLTQRANLSALAFHPVGDARWPASPDANAMLVQGPNGVITRDMGGGCTMTQTPTAAVWVVGGVTVTIDARGLTVTGGDVKADAIGLKPHKHSGVMSGGGNSGPAVP